MATKVRKAVIPAAGYGTRFLPVTKTLPKEMLPIVDKPVIQYVVEEAVAAGIEQIIFVTSSGKHALEDYFDYLFELEENLKKKGRDEDYRKIREVSDMAEFAFVRQKEMKGTGHAVLAAKNLIGDEPFLVLWGDEIIDVKPGRANQLIELYKKVESPVITLVESNNPDDTKKYGFAQATEENGHLRVTDIIEKPFPNPAPSKYLSLGGQLLTPDICPILEKTGEVRGEIYLADAIGTLAKNRPLFGCLLQNATFYDTGNKLGFIKANIELGLKRPEIKEELLAYLESLRDA